MEENAIIFLVAIKSEIQPTPKKLDVETRKNRKKKDKRIQLNSINYNPVMKVSRNIGGYWCSISWILLGLTPPPGSSPLPLSYSSIETEQKKNKKWMLNYRFVFIEMK